MTLDQQLATAREEYAAAVRAERLSRITAAPQLRARTRHRRAGLRLLAAAAVIVGVALLAVALAGVLTGQSAQRTLDRAGAARAGAVTAISTMLSADPETPDAYVERVLAVTAGRQHERLTAARSELRGAVAELGAASTGRVVSAGAQEPSSDGVPVIVIAQASAPELVGGVPGTDRVAVRVLMVQDGDRWLIESTERVS